MNCQGEGQRSNELKDSRKLSSGELELESQVIVTRGFVSMSDLFTLHIFV